MGFDHFKCTVYSLKKNWQLKKSKRKLWALNCFLAFSKFKCLFHYLFYPSFDWIGFRDGIVISSNLLTTALLLVLKGQISITCVFFLMLWVILSLLYPVSFVCGFTTPLWSQESGSTALSDIISCSRPCWLWLVSLNMIIFILEYQQQYKGRHQGCVQHWWKQTQLTWQHGALAWTEGHSWTTAVKEVFIRREGENNCQGWRHLVEKAYETEREGRKERRKMYFSVEGACRQESDKIAKERRAEWGD